MCIRCVGAGKDPKHAGQWYLTVALPWMLSDAKCSKRLYNPNTHKKFEEVWKITTNDQS